VLIGISFDELKKDRNKFAAIFVGLLGVVQIFVGIALITAGGPFMTLFGQGLVFGGMGDAIGLIESIATGMPIDLGGYLKGKAIGLAINLIVASILFAFQIPGSSPCGIQSQSCT
jgi:hypothetical protein